MLWIENMAQTFLMPDFAGHLFVITGLVSVLLLQGNILHYTVIDQQKLGPWVGVVLSDHIILQKTAFAPALNPHSALSIIVVTNCCCLEGL